MFSLLLKSVKLISSLERPMFTDKSKAQLITIPFSHFSERARWILDMVDMPYNELQHGPLFHMTSTMITISKFPRYSLSSTAHLETTDEKAIKMENRKEISAVPKLVIWADNEWKVIPFGSNGIYQFLYETGKAPFLYPQTIAKDLIHSYEKYLEKELAISVTVFVIGNLVLPSLEQKDDNMIMNKIFFRNYLQRQPIPAVEKFLFNHLGESLVRSLWIPPKFINKDAVESSRLKIIDVFTQMDKLLLSSSSTNFLNSTFPTALDFSFSSFTFPILFPTELTHQDTKRHLYWTKDEFSKLSASPGQRNILQLSDYLQNNFQSAQHALQLYSTYRQYQTPKKSAV